MKKKLVIIGITLVLVSVVLTGCFGDDSGNGDKGDLTTFPGTGLSGETNFEVDYGDCHDVEIVSYSVNTVWGEWKQVDDIWELEHSQPGFVPIEGENRQYWISANIRYTAGGDDRGIYFNARVFNQSESWNRVYSSMWIPITLPGNGDIVEHKIAFTDENMGSYNWENVHHVKFEIDCDD
jgi:hypothetical protein